MTFQRFLEIFKEYDLQIFTKPKNLETITEEEVRKFAEFMKKQFEEKWSVVDHK